MLESNLQYTNLENTDLQNAELNEEVLFNQTNLKGANLSTTMGLSTTQIKLAIVNKETQLPEYLSEEMDDDFLMQF